MHKQLLGLTVGLLIAVSTIYFVEAADKLLDSKYDFGIFFLLTGIANIVMVILLSLKNKKIYYYITIGGTIILIILYAVTRQDISWIGEMGIVSKSIQVGIIVSSIMALRNRNHKE